MKLTDLEAYEILEQCPLRDLKFYAIKKAVQELR